MNKPNKLWMYLSPKMLIDLNGHDLEYGSDANIVQYLRDMKRQNDSEVNETSLQIDNMRKKLSE